MEFEKLFKALVITGSMIASGCATTDQSKSEKAPAAEEELDCATICEGEGRGAVCPSEGNDGPKNCCWLMPPPVHKCCDVLAGSLITDTPE